MAATCSQANAQPCASGCCSVRVKVVEAGNDAEDSPSIGRYSSLKLDTNGRAHLAYYAQGVGVRYAIEDAAGNFTTRTVDGGANVGVDARIALDRTGAPQLGYRNASIRTLRYAFATTTTFTSQQIDGTIARGDVGWWVDIAMDTQDKPVFAYRNNQLSQLSIAFRMPGSNAFTLRDTTPVAGQSVGEYPSMLIDSAGVIHIVHRNRTQSSLVYTRFASGAFTHETIDAVGNPGTDSQIAQLADGTLVVAYYALTDGVTRIATRSSAGEWRSVTLNLGARNLGSSLGMAVGTGDALHLCLRESEELSLYYARVRLAPTLDVQLRPIVTATIAGDSCSIGIAGNNIAISFYDGSENALKLARFDG